MHIPRRSGKNYLVLGVILFCLTLSPFGDAIAEINGCGTSWNLHLVPDRFPLASCEFRAACDQHDMCYGHCSAQDEKEREPHCEYLRCKGTGDLIGSPECQSGKFETLRQQADRRKLTCDSQFYLDIVKLNSKRVICSAFAVIYSRAVKWFGESAFEGMDGKPGFGLSEQESERSKTAISEALSALEPIELETLVDEIIKNKSQLDWSKELIFDPVNRRLKNR